MSPPRIDELMADFRTMLDATEASPAETCALLAKYCLQASDGTTARASDCLQMASSHLSNAAGALIVAGEG